jgi:hypothetical protein
MWLGDAAYTDDIYGNMCKNNFLITWIDKLDSTMDEEYVKERFQITLDDPCKFEVSV